METFNKKVLGLFVALSVIIASMFGLNLQTDAAEPDLSKNEGTLNYIFVNHPVIQTNETQTIVVSVGDKTVSIDGAVLYYRRDNDKALLTAGLKKKFDNTLMFQITHNETAECVYSIESVKYSVGGVDYFADLSKSGVDAKYAVNTQVDTFPDLYVDSAENVQTDPSVYEITSIYGSSSTKYVDSVDEALSVAEISNFYEKKGTITIALDAGHGGSDSGAVRGALVERDINGKIVEYCKQELEKYSGVKVITTPRSNGSTVTGRDVRCAYAKNSGADVIISFHINAGGGSGAEVWVPKTGSKVAESENLAQKILAELSALGLRNRGTKDGSARGFGMIVYPASYGIPGVLIEHAFIDNGNDTPYLSSETNLKKIGESDAKGIIKYFGISKESAITKNDLYKSDSAKVSFKQSSNKESVTITAKNLEKADGVKFAVWGNENGNTDKEWYKAKLSNNNWKAKFYPYNHGETGKYTVETYVVRKDQSYYKVGKTTINIENKTSANLRISKIKSDRGSFRVNIENPISTFGVKEITAKIWNTEDKEKTSYTYKAKLLDDGSYRVSADVKNHDYTWGKYNVSVYLKDNIGNKTKIASTKVELKRPETSVSVKVNKSQTKAVVNVAKIPGLGSDYLKTVRLKVWSIENGKDDVKWYKAKLKEDKYTYSVPIIDFKSTGKFKVEIYTKYGISKEKKLISKSFSVADPAANVKITKKNDSAGKFRVEVSDAISGGGVKKVSVDVWREQKTNKKTYNPKLRSDGTYRVNIDAADFGCEDGKYYIRAYLYTGQGKKVKVYSKTVTMKAPTTTASVNVSKDFYINLSANNVFGMDGESLKKVQFRIWNESIGKDRLINLNAKLSGNTYKAKTNIGQFDFVAGKYKVQVYGIYANGKSKKLAGKSVKISSNMTNIMGDSLTNANQLARYYRSRATYPSYYKNTDAKTLEAFCKMYIEECKTEGVRAEVAFAQAMKETGFLRYGGRVPIEANNFAGLGAIDSDVTAWATFKNVRTGIRAHVQHLKAYASKDPLKKACVDGRFGLVTRGSALYVEWLGISENPYGKGWATAYRYGYSVIDDYLKPLLKS